MERKDSLNEVTCIYYGTAPSHTSAACPAITPAAASDEMVVVDAAGNKTTTERDAMYRYDQVTDAEDGVTSRAYDLEHNLLSVNDPLSRVTTFTYDSSGNVLTRTNPLNKTWTYTYNSFNDVLTETDPLSNVTTYVYDVNGNLTSITDDLSQVTNELDKVWTYTYDLGGRVTKVRDPLSHDTDFTYNAADQVLTATNHLSEVTTNVYDAKGLLTSVTDAESNVTSFAYDSMDRPTTTTDDLSQVTTNAYDGVGNLTSITNVRSKVTSFTYDGMGRRLTVTDPLSEVTTYVYDDAGQVTSRTDARGLVTEYTYDAAGQVTDVDYKDGETVVADVEYAYNDAGYRTSMTDDTGTTTWTYNDIYQVTRVTHPGSNIFDYTYDANGNRTQVEYPSLDTVDYTYDAANQLTQAKDWALNETDYVWDNAGRLTSSTYPSGVVATYTYDNADRLLSVTNKDGAVTRSSFTYTLDDVGNRAQVVDNQGTTTYAYDDLYRLTSVTYPGPSTDTYTYDAIGNRLTKNTDDYTYNDGDRMTDVEGVTYGYDENGNLTSRGDDDTFTWDHENRMTESFVDGVTTTYTYNGDGVRVSQTSGETTVDYLVDVMAPLPIVVDDGTYQYVYGLDLVSTIDGSDNEIYYLSDGLGSVSDLTDDTGAVTDTCVYDAFGAVTSSTGSSENVFRFTGEQSDGALDVEAIMPEALDTVVSSSNLTGATVANLDEDPDAGDANWATATSLGNTEVKVGFATPSDDPVTGADLQEFRVLLRKDAAAGTDPTYSIELWETGGGSALATLASGSAVELRIIGTASGDRSVEVGAVEWNALVPASGPDLYFLRARYYDPATGCGSPEYRT